MANEIYETFDNIEPSTEPLFRPKAGTTYLFTWTDDTRKNDWRSDGYRWRQNGTFVVNCNSGQLTKRYFQVCRRSIANRRN